jgi:hypothetical protein
MTQHLDSLKIGDTIDVKGPVGHFVYEGRGQYLEGKHRRTARVISLVAGGSGITPCYAVRTPCTLCASSACCARRVCCMLQDTVEEQEQRTRQLCCQAGGDCHGHDGIMHSTASNLPSPSPTQAVCRANRFGDIVMQHAGARLSHAAKAWSGWLSYPDACSSADDSRQNGFMADAPALQLPRSCV